MKTRVFWLSFCDDKFLGACIVDVDEVEAAEAAVIIAVSFPNAMDGAEWIAAASRKAHRLGCNPGGQMLSCEIPLDHPHLNHYPFGVLMSRAAIDKIERQLSATLREP